VRTNVQVGVLKGQFRVLEDNLDGKLSSISSGIQQLQGDRRKKLQVKEPRQTQFQSQRMHTQSVAPSGIDAWGSDKIVEV